VHCSCLLGRLGWLAHRAGWPGASGIRLLYAGDARGRPSAPIEASQAIETTEATEVPVLAVMQAGQVAPGRPQVGVA